MKDALLHENSSEKGNTCTLLLNFNSCYYWKEGFAGKCWFKRSMSGVDFLWNCSRGVSQTHKGLFDISAAWVREEIMFRKVWMYCIHTTPWCFHLRLHFWCNASIRYKLHKSSGFVLATLFTYIIREHDFGITITMDSEAT